MAVQTMSRNKKVVRILPTVAALLLTGCNSVVLRPFGDIAAQQSHLIVISTVLMLLIIVPVIVLTLVFAWHYRQSNAKATYAPEWDHSIHLELIIWAAPLLIVIALGAVTWISTHTLDPYRALKQIEPGRPAPRGQALVIEAVALDWKWLFLYPDQRIAVVNELAAPVDVPIQFKITSENVMNSFFIPALAGQIYAMPGMETQLNAVINHAGDYEGLSANYSGAGFSGMHFRFKGMSAADFALWVQDAKASGVELTPDGYRVLEKPSARVPVQRFGSISPDLYESILNRCLEPGGACLRDTMSVHDMPVLSRKD